MVTPINSTQDATVLSVEMKTFYKKGLIHFARKATVFNQFGQAATIPKNEGGTYEWRRPSQFTKITGAATLITAANQGVTPSGSTLTFESITATPNQYGDYYAGSDRILVQTYDPLLAIVTEEQGYQMAQVLDNLIQIAVIGGSTNQQYVGGGASTVSVAAANIISETELRKALRTLERNGARPIRGGKYVAVIHPDTKYTLLADPDIREAMIYAKEQNNSGSAGSLFAGEIGDYMGITFVESAFAPIATGAGAAGINVYKTVVFAADYFGKVDVSGLTADSIFHGVGSAGAADPLNQRWTQGWKLMHASKLLNELNAVVIQHANLA